MTQSSRFEGKIKDLTYKGLGLVESPNGQVFFVEGAWPGDHCVFEITKMDRRFGHAKIIEMIEPSKDRVIPVCQHHGFSESSCGGCPWMMASYSAQIQAKVKILKNQLYRSNLTYDDSQLKPIFESRPIGYRTRAQFKTNGIEIGFVSRGSKSLAPIDDCAILNDSCRDKFKFLKSQLPNSVWTPSAKFLWNFLEVDDETPNEKLQINSRLPFKQANKEANTFMVDWVTRVTSSLEEVTGCLELFCGSGNFTAAIRNGTTAPIVAAEINPASMSELYERKLKDVVGLSTDVSKIASWSQLNSLFKLPPNVLFLDPPREGFELLGDIVAEFSNIKHMIYISCDPSSLARDLKSIAHLGFNIIEIQPVDQFPQTSHLETLCFLSK